jgi:hypothetical protein
MTDLSRYATSFPVIYGETVTEGHALYCREFGHATHTEDGEESRFCPRCGEDKTAERLFVKANPAPRDLQLTRYTVEHNAQLGYYYVWDTMEKAERFTSPDQAVAQAEADRRNAEREAIARSWGATIGTVGRNGLTRR